MIIASLFGFLKCKIPNNTAGVFIFFLLFFELEHSMVRVNFEHSMELSSGTAFNIYNLFFSFNYTSKI